MFRILKGGWKEVGVWAEGGAGNGLRESVYGMGFYKGNGFGNSETIGLVIEQNLKRVQQAHVAQTSNSPLHNVEAQRT